MTNPKIYFDKNSQHATDRKGTPASRSRHPRNPPVGVAVAVAGGGLTLVADISHCHPLPSLCSSTSSLFCLSNKAVGLFSFPPARFLCLLIGWQRGRQRTRLMTTSSLPPGAVHTEALRGGGRYHCHFAEGETEAQRDE